jgi:RHS repeat-associated protein
VAAGRQAGVGERDVAPWVAGEEVVHRGIQDLGELDRPGAVDGVALQWDRNGNLVQKGSVAFHYDFRNRLVDVTDSSSGAAIAHYEYDAFNRRITKTVGTAGRLTVWQGWRPVEDYDTSSAPRLLARRTYGSGLDDIVYLESDLDGSGNVAAKSWPLYDASGNVALLTDGAGKPLERYDYTPYGAQKILVNSTSPAVQQVRVVGGAIWVELSEAVQPGSLSSNPTFGAATPVTLFDTTANKPFGNLAASQPVTTGDLALRRIVITAAPPTGLHTGDQVTLTIPAVALVDNFLNQPAQDYALTFAWPAGDAVVADLAAPAVQRLTLRQGSLELELTSEPNLAAATAAIQLDGEALAWTLGADHYTLTSTTQVPAGAHTLTVGTTLTDLGGTALAAPFSQSFTAAQAQDSQALFVAPDPQQSSASAVGNLFGYQGLPRDPETGLIYFRNRYYDPELGRFITADPKGYVDGPSMYAFEMDDPANGRDPMGTCNEKESAWDCAKRIAGQAVKDTAENLEDALVGVGQGLWASVQPNSPYVAPKDSDTRARRFGQNLGASMASATGDSATGGGLAAATVGCGASVGAVAVAGPVGAAVDAAGPGEVCVGGAVVAVGGYLVQRNAGQYMQRAGQKGTSSGKAEPEPGSQKPDKDLTAAERRAKNSAKGIPESELGPSGKPKRHSVQHASEKRAKDAARARAGKGGTTDKHPSPARGGPHYHGQTQTGKNVRVHDEYPK